jgi:hypothetical protein
MSLGTNPCARRKATLSALRSPRDRLWASRSGTAETSGLKMSDRHRTRWNFHGRATFPSVVPTELSAMVWGQASRENPRDTFIGELRGNACHKFSCLVRRSD